MAVSKLNREDAQEWLESLKLVGEGWWRQVGLAVRANAHKSLGMDRREFAQAIGQRMIDPRDAIIELHKEGHSVRAIADILSVGHDKTVRRILIEEGLIEPPALPASDSDKEDARVASDNGDPDALQARIEQLEAQVTGEQKKSKDALKKVKDEMAELRKAITEERRRAREEAQKKLTEAERERARKEADAWAEEQGRKVLMGFTLLAVDHVVSALEEATGDVRLLIEQDAVTGDALRKIETAHAGFQDELNVARMAVSVSN